jgi:predicted metal-dependent hydrolase
MISADIIKRTKRKTLSISIERDGRVIVKAPYHVSQKKIDAFILSSQDWIEKHVAEQKRKARQSANINVADNETVVLFGEEYSFVFYNGKSGITGNLIFINSSCDPVSEFKKVLKPFALEYLEKRVEFYGRNSGLVPESVSISTAEKRWGSCVSNGRIHFTIYLSFCEPELTDYVVVHELCHLKHMNHSPEFWALVESIMPDYRERKKRLRETGNFDRIFGKA